MNGKIFNDFNRSSVRPEALEGSTEGFSAESIHCKYTSAGVGVRVAKLGKGASLYFWRVQMNHCRDP